MKLTDLSQILVADSQFKSNVKFATVIAVAVGLYGSYYGLSKRVSDIEDRFAKPGEIEVSLEKDAPPHKTKKATAKVKGFTQLYNNKTYIRMSNRELNCIARNIYHEAGFEPYIGKIAVAQVTFNRVQSGKWGNGFCDVVYARKQFSWTLFPKMRNATPKGSRWVASLHAAKMFQAGVRVHNLENSQNYHATYVHPKWRNDFKRVAQIKTHIFYAKAD